MKRLLATVVSVKPLTGEMGHLIVKLPENAEKAQAGQFAHISVPSDRRNLLRRPISICDWDDSTITLLYRAVGEGTRRMAAMGKGETLDLLVGLGNGYTLPDEVKAPLLVGGGAGVPPMYALAKAFLAKGITPTVVLGFRNEAEIFYKDEFEALGVRLLLALGSTFVTDRIREDKPDYDYFYACGPEPMLKALSEQTVTSGQLSFEERMGCGFGACMGCTCKTKYGNKRICTDGPVLVKEEIIW